ncbi:DUF1295 domain-containing protein [Acidovorax sp. NCPPB 3576]|uniref:DUF1295 domain-containing protein n=1 Tax=Acidovorax sp. NCPPB 3576 TaxID=2940488 RepID=UPI002349630B|nr:DUF1295 domain-containing protein [Acidovorax sp. NCPPB 3576]WCM87237.1 DUF1295 domain-containing protein [Acidovorax sp. NCPPB 3576]
MNTSATVTWALYSLAWALSVSALTWLGSLARKDASLADRAWPVLIAGCGAVYWALAPTVGARGIALLLLSGVWGLRLCAYITRRNWGHGEDHRYRAMRERNRPNFAFKSLYLVFGLQALLAWIVSAPLLAGLAATPGALSVIDWIGMALAVFGIVFEAVGDAQMARFKSDPAHAGQVMDRGLWRFTRHPNYFGEACVWWGIWLLAVGATGWAGVWTVVSPLLMTVLLLRVSGVALLEKDIAERRPAYRDYMLRTNAFIPGPPRTKARR